VFKAWFVDFEPVKAKAAGATAFPGMPPETFATLPTRLVDSELGLVPEGWEIAPLADIFEVGLGGQWGADEATDKENYPARCLRGIDCHELASGTKPDIPLRWLKSSLATKRALKDGVVLVEGSGSFCGRSFLWRDSYRRLYQEDVLFSNFVKRLDPRRGVEHAVVGWYHLKSAYQSGAIANHRTGSAFPNLDVDGLLKSFKFPRPDCQTAKAFAEFVEPFSTPHLIAESCKLATLRDYLLPRLLSGRVRVSTITKTEFN
jgi:type I restriction enzyme S subunit